MKHTVATKLSSIQDQKDVNPDLKERLANNSFKTDGDMRILIDGIDPSKQAYVLEIISKSQKILDAGTGEAKLCRDILKQNTDAEVYAINYKNPTNMSNINELLKNEKFHYNSDRLFHQYKDSEFDISDLEGRFDLIIDNRGVLMYTDDISRDLRRNFDILEVGGKVITLKGLYCDIDGNGIEGNDLAIINFLRENSRGINIDQVGGTDFVIEKTDEDVFIPDIFLNEELSDFTQMPPKRSFSSSKIEEKKSNCMVM